MFDYQSLIKECGISSVADLNKLFWDEIWYDWVDAYEQMSEKHGTITLQNFRGYAFIIDDGNQLTDNNEQKEILESRVIGAFGISNTDVNAGNRKMMRKWLGKSLAVFSPYGTDYDKGHFIAHGFVGPIDVNLFPQKRDINRGWSDEGKVYRTMEKYVTANPGTFVFSRPIYNDLSFCPSELEYGYCGEGLEFVVRRFGNR